ncbi:tRNA-intron lyase [Candidatus Woesearchaeota archaeon]|nr:tRNA-intron lyase [Candidatus Woesearchaeota archaeon]
MTKEKKDAEAKPEIKITGVLSREQVIAEDSQEARTLYDQSRFGELKENKFYYSLVEALYLLEKGRMEILDGKKSINHNDFIKKAKKSDPRFWVRYVAYRDMRSRGYIVKTALKFGADFRVYERGIKPGDDHAKWIMYPVYESEGFSWYEFSAKNRVAHSTRKNLLIAVVDEENDVTFYQISWIRP